MLKKFKKSELKKEIKRSIQEMSLEDAYITKQGIYNLYEIICKYMKDTYGSCKRENDITEYTLWVMDEYNRKYKKEMIEGAI